MLGSTAFLHACSSMVLFRNLFENAARNAAEAAARPKRACAGVGGWGVIWESETKQTNKQTEQEHLGNWAFRAFYENIGGTICRCEMCCCCRLLTFKNLLSQISSRQKCTKVETVDSEGMDCNWCDPVSRSPAEPPPPQKKRHETKQTNTQRLRARYAFCNCRTVQMDLT